MAVEYVYVEGEVRTPSITIYSVSTCSHCAEARALLGSMRLAYRYVLVDMLPPADRFIVERRLKRPETNIRTYPVLEICKPAPCDEPGPGINHESGTNPDPPGRVYGYDPEVWAHTILARP